MSSEAALGVFDSRGDEFLEDLMTFLRFETVSTEPAHREDMQSCANWIRDQLVSAGLDTEIVETGGHPAVLADSGPPADRPDATTLLFYGHYDVQPAGDLDLWQSPPFQPEIRDGVIFARGSTDDKGQVMTHLAAVRSWQATGKPWPVRVKFLIEGEEEIGSPHLPQLVRDHRDRLACDYVVISDTAKRDEDTPALTCSTRGLVYKQITLDGPARDLHSGQFGGAVANPANILCRLIASLHDADGGVTIPGFYQDVVLLSEDERRELAHHAMTDNEMLASTGSPRLAGERGWTAAERTSLRPSLDVNGMISGYTKEGSSTIIPARASAKVSMRLVPDQDPARISQAFDEAVQAACPPSVNLRIDTQAACAAYLAPSDSAGMEAARQALTEAFGRAPVPLREGGTLPILPLFKEVLGADSVMLGFSVPDCNLHGPNELFHQRDFERGTRCILRFLEQMGHEST